MGSHGDPCFRSGTVGMFSKKLPADYQTIADPVARVIDSLVSDHLADKVVDEGVDRIVKNKQQQNKLE